MLMVSVQGDASWWRLRGELKTAYEDLVQLLGDESRFQDLLDAYLKTKRLSATAYQALILRSIPDHSMTWAAVRQSLDQGIRERFAGLVPDWALKVPYGSKTHEQLFCILIDRRGEQVPADYLRIVTADAVHAERRVRELRELGLGVVALKSGGEDAYSLKSADVDLSVVPTIVANQIRANKKISESERRALQEIVDGQD
ncbi:hypothetical protein [Geodermatophilus sp. SYSU D00698]